MSKNTNLPQENLNNIPAEKVRKMLSELSELRKLPKVQTDAECQQRIDQYFQFCEERGLRPGVEGLSLSLGVSRQTLWSWKNGCKCSERRTELIQSATQFITMFIEQAFLSGNLNPVSGIFLMKAWAGWQDANSIEISVNRGEQVISADNLREISLRYHNDVEQTMLPVNDYSALGASDYETELPTE